MRPTTTITTTTRRNAASRRDPGALLVETRRGWPVSLEWNGRREVVLEIADFWVVEGNWWRDPRRRVCFRIRTDKRMLDLYVTGGHWSVSRVWD